MTIAPGATASAERYLSASPAAVHRWLGDRTPSRERALMLYVLAQPGGCPVEPPVMAAALGESTQTVARTLFALTRTGCLQVHPGQPVAMASTHWTGLQQHLESLALSAGSATTVLADPSGLCIASAHASLTEGQHMAAAAPQRGPTTVSWALYPDHDGPSPFVVTSVSPIAQTEPAWVALAQDLVGMLRPHRPWRHTEPPDHAS